MREPTSRDSNKPNTIGYSQHTSPHPTTTDYQLSDQYVSCLCVNQIQTSLNRRILILTVFRNYKHIRPIPASYDALDRRPTSQNSGGELRPRAQHATHPTGYL